ncbi:oligopeptide/dipeptide ABC transporter ATP-binding protein [Tissierella praeacuta]|uniref:ABC transporter ATP-binding protein n=1 Tax=Tissierella praeacuta TaxID=43131 RepID=UPI00333F4B30
MEPILQVRDLKKYFNTPKGLLHAVDGVTFDINKGETLGVVGESGCGKSTLGRVILHLLEATDGELFYEGEDITKLTKTQFRELRQKMQIIFQDPFSSLNPRMTVSEIIKEPLIIHKVIKDKRELDKKVSKLMDTVGLADRLVNTYPHELDGGRRQRIGIARALALSPGFIVCDEPVSALDVSIQAQVLNLMQDLQKEMDLTYMFITHDLSVVKHISNDILVMYLGQLVEKASSKDLFKNPLHPYTKALLSAIPVPSLKYKRERVLLKGELASPINPKPGCRFAQRCIYAKDNCHVDDPVIEEVMPGHFVACHHIREINGLK